jgi:hypothetical protein
VSLYTDGGCVIADVLTLHTLRELCLNMNMLGSLSSISHAPPHQGLLYSGYILYSQLQGAYAKTVESYHTFIKYNSNSLESGVVVTQSYLPGLALSLCSQLQSNPVILRTNTVRTKCEGRGGWSSYKMSGPNKTTAVHIISVLRRDDF